MKCVCVCTYVCVHACNAKKTLVLESCEVPSNDGDSWEAVVGQAHDCVGGSEGHLGSLEAQCCAWPSSQACFLAEIYVYFATFRISGTCVTALLDKFVRQGGFNRKGGLTETY